MHRDAYNLLCCFRDRRHEVTRYWADPAVPAKNNQAERTLKMVKLRRKISGFFMAFSSVRAFCVVRSCLQTARKHGLKGLDVVVKLLKGNTVGRLTAITSAGGLNRYVVQETGV